MGMRRLERWLKFNTDESWLIDFEVNPNLKPYLLNISKNFTSYHLDHITKLKSYYSIRLYELLKQYQDKTGGWWWKVTLEKLKETLKIKTTQYKFYSHLKNKVILVAQKELAQKTDIKFTFEEQKKGRRVDVLTFYILPNIKPKTEQKETTKKVPEALPKYTKNKGYKVLTQKLKIDEWFIAEIYKNYDENKILNNANHTLRELEKENIKSSIGGFLRKALKNDYASQKSLLTLQEEQREAKEKEKLKQQKLKEEKAKKEAKLKQDFQRKITEKVEKYISKNEDNLDNYHNQFKEKFSFVLGSESDIKKAINENSMTKNFFINFLSKKVLDKKELDFEEFLRSRK